MPEKKVLNIGKDRCNIKITDVMLAVLDQVKENIRDKRHGRFNASIDIVLHDGGIRKVTVTHSSQEVL